MKNTLTATDKCLFACISLLLLASGCIQLRYGYSGDKAWMLILARMIISGKKIYHDILEINPPLIFWIYTIPVAISAHIGVLKDYHVLVLMAFCLVGVSIYVCTCIMNYNPVFMDDARKRLQFVLLLCLVDIVFAYPDFFADREHTIFILTLPYILRFTPSVARKSLPRGLKLATAVMAGVGFCIKPHTALVFAAVQLLYIFREKSLRILVSLENIIICAMAVCYLYAVWRITPEYYTVLLPMLMQSYAAVTAVAKERNVSLILTAVTCVLILVGLRLRRLSPYRADILYCLAITVAWMGYVYVNNGWDYTYFPLTGMLMVACAFMLWEYGFVAQTTKKEGLPTEHLVGVYACSANFIIHVLLAVSVYATTINNCERKHACVAPQQYTRAFEESGAHSFGAIMIGYWPFQVLLQSYPDSLVTRFANLWMLNRFFVTGQNTWVADYVAHGMAEDIKHNRPDIVFVEANPQLFTTYKQADVLTFLNRYQDFSDIWAHYHYIRSIDNCGARKSFCKIDIFKFTP